MSQVAIHLVVLDADDAARWYRDVLGARIESTLALPSGRTLIVEVRIGETLFALASEIPSLGLVAPLTLGGSSVAYHVEVEDPDAVHAKALATGGRQFEPMTDAIWGVRTGQFLDPSGHRWAVDRRTRNVEPEELQRLLGESFEDADGVA